MPRRQCRSLHIAVSAASTSTCTSIPMNASQYWRKPKLAINCADSSAVHSVIIDLGSVWSSPGISKIVGVCSFDGGSESVGEPSESNCIWVGEVIRLLSYSSSASESAWYAAPVGKAMAGQLSGPSSYRIQLDGCANPSLASSFSFTIPQLEVLLRLS